MAQLPDNLIPGNGAPGSDQSDGVDFTTGTAEPADFGLASGFTPRRSPNGGMLLLLGVIGVAAATLYAMRVGGHVDVNDASLVGVETKIEQALARLKADGAPPTGLSAEQLATMFKDTDEVVATFAADLTRKQVTLDYLQKNPFELFSPDGPKEVKTADQAALDQAKVARQKKLKAELDTMKLQSLMSGGATRLAVVAGKVVREGDQVGSFTVTGISSAGVLLTADGNTWTLTMEQPGEKKK